MGNRGARNVVKILEKRFAKNGGACKKNGCVRVTDSVRVSAVVEQGNDRLLCIDRDRRGCFLVAQMGEQ